VKIAGGQPVAIGSPGEYGGLAWIDATHLGTTDNPKISRNIRFTWRAPATVSHAKSTPSPKRDFGGIPDWGERGRSVAFAGRAVDRVLSDEDGWDHLYVMPGQEATLSKLPRDTLSLAPGLVARQHAHRL